MKNSDFFRKELSKLIKDTGKYLIEESDNIVGNLDMLYDLNIIISFKDKDGIILKSIPSIKIEKEYLCKNTVNRINDKIYIK